MRISDSMRYKLFQMNVSKVGKQLDDIETRISTQKNINTPSDDPIKYTTNVLYDADLSFVSQYNSNLQRLDTMISMYDVSFGSMASQLDDLAKLANNFDSMGQDLKTSAIEQIKGTIEQFVTIGNNKLGNAYIFGGQQADTPPFQLNNDYSVTFNVDQRGEDATKIYVDKAQSGQYGISGREAFYGASKISFGDVTNAYTGDIYSNTDSFAYVINASNNSIQMNGATVTLTSGVYTGGSLAKEIEQQLGSLYIINDSNNTFYRNGTAVTLTNGTYTGATLAAQVATQLGAGYAATYNAVNKTFSITNNTGGNVTLNWSNAGSTAADVLGFNRQDTVVASLGSDTSDHSVANFTSVAFDSTTRKFDITNNTGADITLNWSNAGSTAAGVLGFDAINSVVAAGKSDTSDIDSGRKSFLVEIATSGATAGALGSRATYQYSIDDGATWSAGLTVNTGGADTTADIIITSGVNDTLYLNGAAVTLTGNVGGAAYTGDDLATEIQMRLNAVRAGHTVSYNGQTRKFTITNNTGAVETFNWSNTGANAAGVLGFDNVDSVVSNSVSDESDYDAGMFIDGAGVANATNNRIKLLFSVGATDNLTGSLLHGTQRPAGTDSFQVKDFSIFELLKNFKDAFESDNATWVSKNIQYIDTAKSLTTRNNAVIAFQGTLANTLTENNKTKTGKIQTLQSDLVNADMSELATEFNVLLNTYQALLSTLAKMQSVSILNYLK